MLYLSQNTEINEEFTFWLQLEFRPVTTCPPVGHYDIHFCCCHCHHEWASCDFCQILFRLQSNPSIHSYGIVFLSYNLMSMEQPGNKISCQIFLIAVIETNSLLRSKMSKTSLSSAKLSTHRIFVSCGTRPSPCAFSNAMLMAGPLR